MSYLRAEDILPKEVLELVQRYVDGQTIYIPRKEKRSWGEGTDTKKALECRNDLIVSKYRGGASAAELADEFYLSEKSIQRIVRKKGAAPDSGNGGADES